MQDIVLQDFSDIRDNVGFIRSLSLCLLKTNSVWGDVTGKGNSDGKINRSIEKRFFGLEEMANPMDCFCKYHDTWSVLVFGRYGNRNSCITDRSYLCDLMWYGKGIELLFWNN